ncbi:hypothetical protein FHS29_002266 [Saccharothrix tamanrassetensis]|uniref:RloB-like protein n=1 Tax=Saccharothrix tamanrassetensis TaxID=1051531 RepID=A0A841CI53_9PSEU|nr:RloB family protein [Saccharothrix tamanrassetensis]MBB5955685.1 hypothetical protein [Saccharothrix tamanrassetensis]
MIRRDPSPRRRPARRQAADRILAVCCGNTEKQYLDGLKRVARVVTLKTVVKVGSPEQLVGYATKLRDNGSDSYDQIWCVVDVDDFDIAKALLAAAKARVSLAVSNPCFELWLILHFADHSAHLAGYKQARAVLEKHVPGYNKELDYSTFHPRIDAAIARAKALGLVDPSATVNPSTTVWRLVEAALNR